MEAYGGSLKKTKIDLSYAQVVSPIDGLAGIADVRIGNLVGKNEPTLLTTVSSIDPIRVVFPISEKEYLNAPEALRNPEKIGKPNEGYLELVLANGKVYPHKGRLAITNRQFDQKTGSIILQALFPNPEMTLRPGQYARIRAAMRQLKDALLVPQRAVQELQGISQLAIVGADNKVEIRTVKMGERTGSFWIVAEGSRQVSGSWSRDCRRSDPESWSSPSPSMPPSCASRTRPAMCLPHLIPHPRQRRSSTS